MSCACPIPRESVNPRTNGSCVACGKIIDPNWSSNDQTLGTFLDRLRDAFPGEPPEGFDLFRRHCEHRERAGRKTFGESFHGRDNLAEGLEELVDLVLYMHLDILKSRRAGGDEDWDTALSAAFHAVKSREFVRQRIARRSGSP